MRGGGLGTYIGYVNIVRPGEWSWGTEIRYFIFWEAWFHVGGLGKDIGDVNIGGGGGGGGFGDRYEGC